MEPPVNQVSPELEDPAQIVTEDHPEVEVDPLSNELRNVISVENTNR